MINFGKQYVVIVKSLIKWFRVDEIQLQKIGKNMTEMELFPKVPFRAFDHSDKINLFLYTVVILINATKQF